MTYSVGNSEVANYANTSSGKVTNVVADDGLGGSGVVTDVTDRVTLDFVVATNIQFLTIDVTSLAGYVAGITDVTVTVNAGVYVYGTPPARFFPNSSIFTPPSGLNNPDASMQIIGGAAGDTVKLVNNGNIVGYGGDGGGVWQFTQCGCNYYISYSDATKGNAALSFITPGITLSIENNGYIAGGGGGGGGAQQYGPQATTPGGGGGAGGGISGVVGQPIGASGGTFTVRAIPPNAGNNGQASYVAFFPPFCCCQTYLYATGGGGGGFVLPGTGGVFNIDFNEATGGGAGGSGSAVSNNALTYDNNGGSANNAAPTYTKYEGAHQGGGGGGWGASGAAGYNNLILNQVGATGGNSIVTNGNAYTLTGSGTLYGSVDTALRSVVYTFPTSSETRTVLDLVTIPGYTAGANVVLLVPANVKLSSNDYIAEALDIQTSNALINPPSVRLVINGAILGAGGIGGSETTQSDGGNAIYLTVSGVTFIIDNTNGYLAGGGGGGGRSQNNSSLASATIVPYGGGGAGLNGSSGVVGDAAYNAGVASGVSSGTNGTVVVVGPKTYASGGSGGTILPGARTTNNGTFPAGTYAGLGGKAGGAGAFSLLSTASSPGNYGGAYKENGGAYSTAQSYAAGGGGGWGSTGGSGRRFTALNQAGRVGGKAIKNPNSNIIFVASSANIAGSVSV